MQVFEIIPNVNLRKTEYMGMAVLAKLVANPQFRHDVSA